MITFGVSSLNLLKSPTYVNKTITVEKLKHHSLIAAPKCSAYPLNFNNLRKLKKKIFLNKELLRRLASTLEYFLPCILIWLSCLKQKLKHPIIDFCVKRYKSQFLSLKLAKNKW